MQNYPSVDTALLAWRSKRPQERQWKELHIVHLAVSNQNIRDDSTTRLHTQALN